MNRHPKIRSQTDQNTTRSKIYKTAGWVTRHIQSYDPQHKQNTPITHTKNHTNTSSQSTSTD